MKKTILKTLGIACVITTLLSLGLPLFRAEIGSGEMWDATFRGFDLMEFSVWGVVTVLAPIILLGIMFSRTRPCVKSVLIMLPALGGIMCFSTARLAMGDWVYSVATGYVQPYGGSLVYTIGILLASVLFYLQTIFEENGKTMRIQVAPIDVLKEEFLLCPHPVEFTKMERELPYEEFNGCMSFSTEDGYFAALGHGVDEKYIKNGCVEVADDDRLYGFVMRSMASGVYGSFYEDYANAPCKKKILPYSNVSASSATLLIPAEGGSFSEHPVTLNPVEMMNIGCYPKKDVADTDIDGAVIIQRGKIAAVVSGYDAENAKFDCVSAELVAADLARMVYEQKVLEEIVKVRENNT